MKELDKTKKYDLSKLTDEQLIEFIEVANKDVIPRYNLLLSYVNKYRHSDFLCFNNGYWNFDWLLNDRIPTCATELFEDDKGNVVTQYDRMMINEVNKPMTEEEKELWLFVYKESVKDKQCFIPHNKKADQAVKDFREALKM